MFLESDPDTLTPAGWIAKQKSWGVTQCTPASSQLNIKKFIEDTCSQITCDEATKKLFLERFDRISKLGVE